MQTQMLMQCNLPRGGGANMTGDTVLLPGKNLKKVNTAPGYVALMPTVDACAVSPVNCSIDMRGYTFPLSNIHKSGKVSYAKQNGTITNFYDVSYKDDEVDLQNDDYYPDVDDFTCVNPNSCISETTSLFYYAYYPTGIDYSNCKLPAIILFHAGGFSDCSGLNYEDTLCYALARKGFIVFNVEYRRGRIKDAGTIYTSAQQMLAIYRAFQDGRGAIRSIIKRQRNILYNNFPYQIDTMNIFVAGQSAGATIANSLAYYRTQSMIDAVFPVPPGEMAISTALGSIDADYYYGDPYMDYQSSIKGLWSMWGGFPIPTVSGISVNEYNFLTQNGADSLVPMIGFMGKKDPVFPIQKKNQYIFYPPTAHSTYTTETSCLISSPFKVYNIHDTASLRMACTNDIYNMLIAHGYPALEYIDNGMGHGLMHVCKTCICPTDFGVAGNLTTNQVNEYLAARAAFFFQSILNFEAKNLAAPSLFVSCEDYRHSTGACANAADNNNCP